MKVKKNDTVLVLTGKDSGKTGKVLRAMPSANRVVVEGVNMVTKHTKPSAANQNGGIVKQEGPIDASNVMYLHKGKAVRVGFQVEGDKKVRVAKVEPGKVEVID